jgi:hypothetical protein
MIEIFHHHGLLVGNGTKARDHIRLEGSLRPGVELGIQEGIRIGAASGKEQSRKSSIWRKIIERLEIPIAVLPAMIALRCRSIWILGWIEYVAEPCLGVVELLVLAQLRRNEEGDIKENFPIVLGVGKISGGGAVIGFRVG